MSSTTEVEFQLLSVAFVLCAIIGVERQIAQKSAGLRTHILVGVGSAGFTLVGAYGFPSLVAQGGNIDPSRIAAQVVSGIGFLGAGVIFMRRDVVRGLTTAASIWLTAAVGMACGADLIALAMAMTTLHLVTVVLVTPLARRLPSPEVRRTMVIRYTDGRGVLREILAIASDMGYQTMIRSTKQVVVDGDTAVVARMQFRGRPPLQTLMTELTELSGVQAVDMSAPDSSFVD